MNTYSYAFSINHPSRTKITQLTDESPLLLPQMAPLPEQLDRIMAGGTHAFFTWKYYIKTLIASRYTDYDGLTPIHVGRQEFIPGECGWGVRWVM